MNYRLIRTGYTYEDQKTGQTVEVEPVRVDQSSSENVLIDLAIKKKLDPDKHYIVSYEVEMIEGFPFENENDDWKYLNQYDRYMKEYTALRPKGLKRTMTKISFRDKNRLVHDVYFSGSKPEIKASVYIDSSYIVTYVWTNGAIGGSLAKASIEEAYKEFPEIVTQLTKVSQIK